MDSKGSAAVRRFWLVLYTLAAGLVLLLLFLTLAERPFHATALRHFSLETLNAGRQFSREVRVAVTLNFFATLALLLWLCFRPGGAALMRRLEAMGRRRLWAGVLAVAAGLTVLSYLVDLPFAYYLDFWHERAYGLSNQTLGDWFAEQGKSLLMALVTAVLLYLPMFWMIRRWPRGWWLPASFLNFALTGILVFLTPVLVIPMFYERIPVEDPAVYGMIQRLAVRAGVQVESVSEIRVSAETSRVNAMVTGLGPTRQVILYDTLLQQFTPEEVEVVVAHELSHAANRDVTVAWLLEGVGNTMVLGAAAWVLRRSVGEGPLDLPAPHAPRALALLMLLFTLAGQISAPLDNTITRRAEVRADRFALTVTGNPEAYVAAFKKLASGNPSDVDPHPVVEFLDHSHPSITNRIRLAEP